MRIEIIYMDRTKASEEFVCKGIEESLTKLKLIGVTHPLVAPRVTKNLDDVDYFVEYEEEE